MTAKRVRQAARERGHFSLFYRAGPAPSAANTISVIMHDLTHFSTEIIRGVEAAAQAFELSTVLAIHREDNELEAKHLAMASRGQVDGLIVVPARSNSNYRLYDELKRRGVPFVFVDRRLPSYEADFVGTKRKQPGA